MSLTPEQSENYGLRPGQRVLTKPTVYESKRIRLTSPALHIGSESQRLSPFEYVATDQYVYLPDVNALTSALLARGKAYLDAYIGRLERREEITSLLEDALGRDWPQAQAPDGRIVFPENRRSLRQTNQQISDLRPMIRNGLGEIYIPGSSIKGAIRTAIAYHLIKHADQYSDFQAYKPSKIEAKIRRELEYIPKKR
ncbi:MAG: type III-A CRISPR-associated RAMP protein Csm5, partial [Cyanothece sp. SIO2G6]|nr:type III-A CRISPR-associated RAMP protein Csm5 [Cyanothece sp. SIO2G6]